MRTPYDDDCRKLLSQLKRHEGKVTDGNGLHVPYRCPAGRLTIGYGHNLEAAPVPGVGGRLTEDQAERLLAADVMAVREQLSARLPWAEALDGPRRAALVNMAFNLGLDGLMGFRKTLTFLRHGDFRNAAREMLTSAWAAQVGGRARELARQMNTGAWQQENAGDAGQLEGVTP